MMRRRTRYTYCTPQELIAQAVNSPHRFQAEVAREMLEQGWLPYGNKSMDNVMVVFMKKSIGCQSCIGVLYPDGSFTRQQAHKKSVQYSWIRAKDAANATVRSGLFA